MAELQGPVSDSLFQEWNLLDDRIVWQGPVETWARLPKSRLASGGAFASLLGAGGAERMAAIRDAAATSHGLFEARFEVRTGRARFAVEEHGKCVRAPDGRIGLVRSRLRRSAEPIREPQDCGSVDGVLTRRSLFSALARLLDAGEACQLLHVELRQADEGAQGRLLRPVSHVLRHGDMAAPFDEGAVLAVLRGADHEQVETVSRKVQAQWSAAGGVGLNLSAVAAPKFGRSPALLLHRLLTTRDIVRARAAAGLVSHSEQLVSRDVSLRRIALGDELVAALNGRAISLTPRLVRHGGTGDALGTDLVAEAELDAGLTELAPLRPLYARLEPAGVVDHRIAELGLAHALTASAPVCIFLSASTASAGWLDLVEASGARRAGLKGRLVVDLPLHEAMAGAGDIEDIARRLRQAGCALSLSGVRDIADAAALDADMFRLSPLALGDLAHSAEARGRLRQIVAGLRARGARVIAPAVPGREAEGFLRACGVALVDGPPQDREAAETASAAVQAA